MLVLFIAAAIASFQGHPVGSAASKTPRPNAARLRSLVTHTVCGDGLYLSGCLWAFGCANRRSRGSW